MENNKDNFYKEHEAFGSEQDDTLHQGDEQNGASIEDVAPDAENIEEAEAENEVNILENKVSELQDQVEKEKKEYLFLMAEFDNFRKRTLREKSELIKNGGESVLKGLLPIMDDFERALKAETTEDSASMKEGMSLIYNNLRKFLAQNGVKEIDPTDDTFDTEKHEAISVVPVPDESKKGKILDTVRKGYTINDKVLRHAQVVVAQ